MPLIDNGANQVLDEIYNAAAGTFPSGDAYLQLHSGNPGAAGTSNVVNIGRQQFATGASSGRTLSNSGNIQFASMPTVTVMGWSVWDAAGSGGPPTGGNGFQYGWFGTVSGLAVVRSGDLTGNDVQSSVHGLSTDDRVAFEAFEALTIPTGITAGTVYYVLSSGLTTDAFRVSTSSGGSTLDITAAGSAVWKKVVPIGVTSGQTFTVNAGDLDLYA